MRFQSRRDRDVDVAVRQEQIDVAFICLRLRERSVVVIPALVFGAVVVALAAIPILRGVRAVHARNAAFLAGAVVRHELTPGVDAEIPLPAKGGDVYALWLDMAFAGPRGGSFELRLSIDAGSSKILDGTYPVTFDDVEHDAKGLPAGSGITALNTKVAATPSKLKTTTVLRAYSFTAPSTPQPIVVRIRVTPGADASFSHLRLLVTDKPLPA